jgi:hypothetical protein
MRTTERPVLHNQRPKGATSLIGRAHGLAPFDLSRGCIPNHGPISLSCFWCLSVPPGDVVVDTAGLASVFWVAQLGALTFRRVVLANLLSPQAGVFAYPLYFISRPNFTTPDPAQAPVALRNVTLVLARVGGSADRCWGCSCSCTACSRHVKNKGS